MSDPAEHPPGARPRSEPTLLVSLARAGATLTLFGLIFAALWLSGIALPLLYVTLAASVAFVTACYLAPERMTRLISMPHAFVVARNLGADGLAFQSVTYAAYHTGWLSRMTHHGWLLDGLAWATLGWLVIGPATAPLLVAWALYEGRTFAEPLFTAALATVWLTTGLAAFALVTTAGSEAAATIAACLLLGNMLCRVVGHLAEPVPPGVLDNRRFATVRELGFDLRLVRATALGLIAEFAAGMPYRLGVFWLYQRLLQLGWTPRAQLDMAAIEEQSAAAHADGWAAAPATRAVSG